MLQPQHTNIYFNPLLGLKLNNPLQAGLELKYQALIQLFLHKSRRDVAETDKTKKENNNNHDDNPTMLFNDVAK